MYLLSSMAERLEWSQEEDEAEGRRRNKQLVSCCCRSMNCFIKLSLEYTTNNTHTCTDGCDEVSYFTVEIYLLKDRKNKHNCFVISHTYSYSVAKYFSGGSCCSRGAPEGDCCVGYSSIKHCTKYKRISFRIFLACRKLYVFGNRDIFALLPHNDYSIKHCFFP